MPSWRQRSTPNPIISLTARSPTNATIWNSTKRCILYCLPYKNCSRLLTTLLLQQRFQLVPENAPSPRQKLHALIPLAITGQLVCNHLERRGCAEANIMCFAWAVYTAKLSPYAFAVTRPAPALASRLTLTPAPPTPPTPTPAWSAAPPPVHAATAPASSVTPCRPTSATTATCAA